MNNETNCIECGELFTKPPPEGGASGYAVRENGARICYACADLEERKFMRAHTVKTAYVSSDGNRVTTWTGGFLGEVVNWSEISCFGHRKTNLTIRAFDGTLWTARATEAGMVCTLRKLKGRKS